MPSSATITAFYVFAPFTKARAVQLNNNFSNLRGHLLPIEPSTATASDQTYDLGSDDHRWRTGFATTISLSISMGSSQVFSGTTAGGFRFDYGATTTFAVLSNAFQGQNATPMGPTTSATKTQMAWSSPINVTLTSAHIANSTCTLVSIGRPVFVGIMHVGSTGGGSGVISSPVAGNAPVIAHVSFLDNGSTIATDTIHVGPRSVAAATVQDDDFTFSPSVFGRLYLAAAGTHVYSLQTSVTSTASSTLRFQNVRLYAYEI